MASHCELRRRSREQLGLAGRPRAVPAGIRALGRQGLPPDCAGEEIALPARLVAPRRLVEVAPPRRHGPRPRCDVARGARGGALRPAARRRCSATTRPGSSPASTGRALGRGARRRAVADRRGLGARARRACSRRWPTSPTSSRRTSPATRGRWRASPPTRPSGSGFRHAERRVRPARGAAARHRPARACPNTIWDKPGPLTEAERERVRLHPYFTERDARAARRARAGSARSPARHHERLDGSGYHRGLRRCALAARAHARRRRRLPRHDRARPHRPAPRAARPRPSCAREVRAGRLDGDAVDAVLAPRATRPAPPATCARRAHRRARSRCSACSPAARRTADRRAARHRAEDRARTTSSTSTPRSASRPAPRRRSSRCTRPRSRRSNRSQDEANAS